MIASRLQIPRRDGPAVTLAIPPASELGPAEPSACGLHQAQRRDLHRRLLAEGRDPLQQRADGRDDGGGPRYGGPRATSGARSGSAAARTIKSVAGGCGGSERERSGYCGQDDSRDAQADEDNDPPLAPACHVSMLKPIPGRGKMSRPFFMSTTAAPGGEPFTDGQAERIRAGREWWRLPRVGSVQCALT
jgi:hypothetical protein